MNLLFQVCIIPSASASWALPAGVSTAQHLKATARANWMVRWNSAVRWRLSIGVASGGLYVMAGAYFKITQRSH